MGLIYVVLGQSYEVDDVCPNTNYYPMFISLDKEKAYKFFNNKKNEEHKHLFRPNDKFELLTDEEALYEFYLGDWYYGLKVEEYKLDKEYF